MLSPSAASVAVLDAVVAVVLDRGHLGVFLLLLLRTTTNSDSTN